MNIKEFLEIPNQERWESEIQQGWDGPDGSSMSSDHIMGVRIGEIGPDFEFAGMPANLHDYRYRLGRRYKLKGSFRKVADAEYRDGCIDAVAEVLDGRTAINLAIARSWIRYFALRLFGWTAWRER